VMLRWAIRCIVLSDMLRPCRCTALSDRRDHEPEKYLLHIHLSMTKMLARRSCCFPSVFSWSGPAIATTSPDPYGAHHGAPPATCPSYVSSWDSSRSRRPSIHVGGKSRMDSVQTCVLVQYASKTEA